MSVAVVNLTQNTDRSWTFSWVAVSGVPYYRVILWGREIARVNTLSYNFSGQAYATDPPPLEIAAGDAKTLSETYRPFVQLQWYSESCSYFQTYEYDGTNWNGFQSFVSNSGWVYTLDTGTLVDESSHTYGVAAVDVFGNESDKETYSVFIVCPPLPPDANIIISYTGSGSHQVQIAAAP